MGHASNLKKRRREDSAAALKLGICCVYREEHDGKICGKAPKFTWHTTIHSKTYDPETGEPDNVPGITYVCKKHKAVMSPVTQSQMTHFDLAEACYHAGIEVDEHGHLIQTVVVDTSSS